MSWAVYLLTIISGLLNPVQSGLTGALEKALERPFTVAAISLSLSLGLVEIQRELMTAAQR